MDEVLSDQDKDWTAAGYRQAAREIYEEAHDINPGTYSIVVALCAVSKSIDNVADVIRRK